MHLHILGICGTFMGGIAALARAAGHRVTGADRNVYPPMSEQLASIGIDIHEGYDPGQLEPAPDCVLVGNVLSRGNPVVEALLDSGVPYTSGPEWLAGNVLAERWVLAVAGTHGKTTTSSILAWILEHAGLDPGFLIGGMPGNFGISARFGSSPFFVIEADEYDTAFFDKRAKFVHYRPRTLALTNLEFDHADIYPDLDAILWQFHQLLRMVPGHGRIVTNAEDANLARLMAMGCWTPVEGFASSRDTDAEWSAGLEKNAPGETRLALSQRGREIGAASWSLAGRHNVENALAAVLAARHAGVSIEVALEALGSFRGIRRRLEVRGKTGGVTVYDDFAHHPTAIRRTLEALRERVGASRIVAVVEPRSNTMKMGVHAHEFAGALEDADRSWVFRPPGTEWDIEGSLAPLGTRVTICGSVTELLSRLVSSVVAGDHVLIMSNGGFEGLHGRLLDALGAAAQPDVR
ncbi:MAG: UDP-N-acetylmuramate:L-alanyl-gamma-D-glutamyl-meso-diaminopimelate ligase [Gammaproteobacteria bacterium]|nr:UDP-N-acetylmuramate:L-alanyl-gamma-D-glutamyl-meso-diaminopimelate ligase [Gammaproteobacteria bacterium]